MRRRKVKRHPVKRIETALAKLQACRGAGLDGGVRHQQMNVTTASRLLGILNVMKESLGRTTSKHDEDFVVLK
jgi:hypothetical protein